MIPSCRIEGCARPLHVRGLCNAHYHRLYRYGDPLGGGPPLDRRPVEQRLADGYEIDEAGCWVWQRSINDNGYGLVTVKHRQRRAHRLMYELHKGPIPEGLVIDHLCRNRACVNPDHLEPVTHRENVRRGVGPAAQSARATHCPSGHPLDGRRPNGGRRYCKTCNRARVRAWKQRRRQQVAAP